MTNEKKPHIVEIGTIIDAILATALKHQLTRVETMELVKTVAYEMVKILTGKSPEEIHEIVNN